MLNVQSKTSDTVDLSKGWGFKPGDDEEYLAWEEHKKSLRK
jgi:hypothetical protein